MSTRITTDLDVDDPIQLTASYRIGDIFDRRYIDDQVRGLEQHLVDALIRGRLASWFIVGDAGGMSAAKAVCSAGDSTGRNVTLATNSAYSASGSILGVTAAAAPAAGKVLVVTGGIIPRSLHGVAGSGGYVRADAAGNLERVGSLTAGDPVVGVLDAGGNLLVQPSLQAPGSGALTAPTTSPSQDGLIAVASAGNLVYGAAGTLRVNGVASSAAPALTLTNNTPADGTTYLDQFSPGLQLTGSSWDGAAAQANAWMIQGCSNADPLNPDGVKPAMLRFSVSIGFAPFEDLLYLDATDNGFFWNSGNGDPRIGQYALSSVGDAATFNHYAQAPFDGSGGSHIRYATSAAGAGANGGSIFDRLGTATGAGTDGRYEVQDYAAGALWTVDSGGNGTAKGTLSAGNKFHLLHNKALVGDDAGTVERSLAQVTNLLGFDMTLFGDVTGTIPAFLIGSQVFVSDGTLSFPVFPTDKLGPLATTTAASTPFATTVVLSNNLVNRVEVLITGRKDSGTKDEYYEIAAVLYVGVQGGVAGTITEINSAGAGLPVVTGIGSISAAFSASGTALTVTLTTPALNMHHECQAYVSQRRELA